MRVAWHKKEGLRRREDGIRHQIREQQAELSKALLALRRATITNWVEPRKLGYINIQPHSHGDAQRVREAAPKMPRLAGDPKKTTILEAERGGGTQPNDSGQERAARGIPERGQSRGNS